MATGIGSYPKTPVPTADELHMLNRMGTGYTPGQLRALRRAGSPVAWFERQLAPVSVAEPALLATIDGWYLDQWLPPATKWQRKEAGIKSVSDYAADLSSWTMLRRVISNRSVLETMVDFWSSHLHITSIHTAAWPWRADYDTLIRKHALGRFDDMLSAASLHPSMLLYLDNFRSEFGNPNENQGRELLELHSVGRGAGYSEDMVKSSAVILSGWTVDYAKTFVASYDPRKHTTGPVRVLGFTDANASTDGRALTERYLRYLAHHPATAQRIATKLAQRFVTASPTQSLIDRLAGAFTASGTDIKSTLRALVSSPEFKNVSESLVRTGPEDAVATARVLGMRPHGKRVGSLAEALPTFSGEFIYTWPRPDGPPRTTDELCTSGRMLRSANTHWTLARGVGRITTDTTLRPTTSWLPQRTMRFDAYVDHLSRVLLGRRSTPVLLQICVAATGVSPSARITKRHAVATWRFVCVAVSMLDSSQHMSR